MLELTLSILKFIWGVVSSNFFLGLVAVASVMLYMEHMTIKQNKYLVEALEAFFTVIDKKIENISDNLETLSTNKIYDLEDKLMELKSTVSEVSDEIDKIKNGDIFQ